MPLADNNKKTTNTNKRTKRTLLLLLSMFIMLLVSSCTSVVRFSNNTNTSASTNKTNINADKDTSNPQNIYFSNKYKSNKNINENSGLNIGLTFRGLASYYHDKFEGRPTASGEIFRQSGMTAAHKELAFGTKVRVTNVNNGQSVIVKINDRGPFVAGRIIDLSYSAASAIELVNSGVAEVIVEVIE